MTNEEKARELAENETFDDHYLTALRMAEWKDQQFKKLIPEILKIHTEYLVEYLHFKDKGTIEEQENIAKYKEYDRPGDAYATHKIISRFFKDS